MGRVVQFPGKQGIRYGLKRAGRKTVAEKREQLGQLNLFTQAKEGKIRKLSPAEGYYEHALNLEEKGSADAVTAYKLAIKEGDNIADSYCNLGVIAFQSGEFDDSLDHFTNALKEDPRHFESHFNLANLYSDKGNYELAVFHYETAVKIEPDFPDSYYNLSLAHIATQKFDPALVSLQKYKMLTGPSTELDNLIENLKQLANEK